MPTVKIQTIFLGWALTSYFEFFAGIFTKCSKPKQLMDAKAWAETEGRNSAEGSVGLLSNSGEVPQGMLPSTHRSNKPRTSETSTKAEPWVETRPQESAITETTWCLCQRQRNRRWCPLRSWVKELQVEVSRMCSFHEVFLPGGISTLPQESKGSSQRHCRDEYSNLALHQKRESQRLWPIMRQMEEIINYQSQSISPSPAIQRKAILTLPHSLQTNAERGSRKDPGIMHILPAATSPSHRILLGLASSNECPLHTCYG